MSLKAFIRVMKALEFAQVISDVHDHVFDKRISDDIKKDITSFFSFNVSKI